MPINPILRGPGYYVNFRNPYYQGKVVFASLSTRDEKYARTICEDLERLGRDKTLWDNPAAPRLAGYEERAVAIFFGKDHPNAQARRMNPGSLAMLQANTLGRRLLGALNIEKQPTLEQLTDFARILAEYDSAENARLKLAVEQNESRLKLLEPENVSLRSENERLHRETNQHVKVRNGEALREFLKSYPMGRRKKTVEFTKKTLDMFLAGSEEKRLVENKPAAITTFLSELRVKRGKGKDAELVTPSPTTLRNKYHALSAFFSWAHVHYEMADNLMARMSPPGGTARLYEHIVAVREEQALRDYLAALQPWPYWQAWVAFACLAGPRYGEQVRMQTSALHLNERYVRIATLVNDKDEKLATKTGLERNIPIERTVLLPIMEKYLRVRKYRFNNMRNLADMEEVTAEAWASPFLFPSITKGNAYKERVLAPVGMWSDNSVWSSQWHYIREQLKLAKGMQYVLKFGPREWRHTCGTALGNCGWDSLKISRHLGNSEDVCRRHYVAPGSGNPWGFKW